MNTLDHAPSLDKQETFCITHPRQVQSLELARRMIEANTWRPMSPTADGVETSRDRQMRALQECGSHLWVVFVDGEPALRFKSCHLRFCPRCSRVLAWKRSQLFEQRISEMRRPSFVTLTMKHNDMPLRDQIQRLSRCFGRLKRRAVWKQAVAGGFHVVEITRNKVTAQYHAHIHAVIDARYMPQDWLSDQWLKITGDSKIVHIRRARSEDARYLAKYATKSGAELAIDADDIWRNVDALRGLRLVGTFGNCRPLTDDGDIFPRNDQSDTIAIPIETLYEQARTDPIAYGYIQKLRARHPWLPDVAGP